MIDAALERRARRSEEGKVPIEDVILGRFGDEGFVLARALRELADLAEDALDAGGVGAARAARWTGRDRRT